MTNKSKDDPTKDPDFQKTLRNLLSAKPKLQSEMKVGKKVATVKKAKKKRATE